MFTNTDGILLKNNQVKGVPINTYISIKNIDHKLKACFFSWYQKHEVGKSYINNSNAVDNQTDFVLSNLPQPVFNKLVYSTDNLTYNYVESDSLFIDDYYHQTDLNFYRNIYCSLSNLGGAYFFDFESKHKTNIENMKRNDKR